MSTNWLPNLVGGVSLWKLADDLNAAKFMDGRLLVPHTDGSDSLPTNVEWDVGGLLPLGEAQAAHGADVEAALRDFAACLERVADEMKKPESGFHGYKDAFTVPALGADDGAHYFYSPSQKKVFVTNWGASPRDFGAKPGYLFSWDHFGAFYKEGAVLAGGAPKAAASTGRSEAPADAKTDDEKKEEKRDEEKKKRPIWHYIVFCVVLALLIALLLLLLKGCGDDATGGKDGAVDLDGAADASLDALANVADGAADANADGAADAAADASGDGSADAGDAGKDAAADAGKDAGDDDEEDWDEDDDEPSGGGGGGGGGSGGGGGGSGGGGKIVKIGPAGATKGGPHRVHVHPEATAWRIPVGNERVARTVERGKRFDVYLAPGKTFAGVRVEYKDAKGQWHAH